MKKEILATVLKFKNKAIYNISIVGDKLYLSDGTSYCGVKRDFIQGDNVNISADDLSKISKRGTITGVNVVGDKTTINIGAKVFTVGAYEEAIKLPEHNARAVIENFEIGKPITNLKTFVSKDDLRPALGGIYYDHKTDQFVATDGHKMQWNKAGLKLSENFILSKAIFNLPAGIYKAELLDKHLYLENENLFAYISLVDERYPDYQQVIPNHSTTKFFVDKSEFKELLADALICANPTTKMARLSLNEEKLSISSQDVDQGKEYTAQVDNLSIAYYEPIEIGINIDFFNTVLSISDTDKIQIELTTANRAIIINWNTLLMPVMLNN